MKKKLLIIGFGPTASLILHNVRQCYKLWSTLDLHVWEKAPEPGGRFSTFLNTSVTNSYADFGAQYLTQSESWSKPYFENLVTNNLIRPLDTSTIPEFHQDKSTSDFLCNNGMQSIVEHFGKMEGVQMKFNTHVKNVEIETNKTTSNNGSAINVTSDDDANDIFDGMISTIPIPQFLKLGNVPTLLEGQSNVMKNLESVKYSSRFALGLFFNDAVESVSSKRQPFFYVKNSSSVRFWSLDSVKRGNENHPSSIVVHSSVDFGAKNLNSDLGTVTELLFNECRNEIPILQTNVKPSVVKCHKWKYSQVLQGYPDSPGCVTLLEQPLLLVAGDGMAHSGFEGCILSAEKTVATLRKMYL